MKKSQDFLKICFSIVSIAYGRMKHRASIIVSHCDTCGPY